MRPVVLSFDVEAKRWQRSVGIAIHVDESFAVGYYIHIDFARRRMEFKSGVRMTERGGQMFPYEVELERPLSSKTGECFHVDVIVSGTILEVYVDNRIALERVCLMLQAVILACMHQMQKQILRT